MQNSLPNNWKRMKLEDVVECFIDYRGKTPKKERFGVPLITAKIIKNGRIQSPNEFVSEETYKKWMNRGFPKLGDVLLTTEAPLGEIATVKDEHIALAQRVILLRANAEYMVNPYLKFWLQSDLGQSRLYASSSGSTVTGVKASELRKVLIELPSTEEQTRIASVLTAFDDKIEINNKIAKTLEEIAQAIFKEWFINFQFPGYEKIEFVESQNGKVPKGWERKEIRDVAKINKGLSYSSSEILSKKGLPMINLANFQRGGGFNPEGVKFYSGSYSSHHVVKPGDIVIAMTDLTSNREVIGHPARVPAYSHWEKVLISLDVCSIAVEDYMIEFLYYLMLRKQFSFRMASSAGGTNISHLSRFTIEEYEFLMPEKSLVEKFHHAIKPIFNRLNILELENQKLEAIRDLLLPKLMKGEITT